jgi:hypothetical protein
VIHCQVHTASNCLISVYHITFFGPCLDVNFFPKFHCVKRRFSITSK